MLLVLFVILFIELIIIIILLSNAISGKYLYYVSVLKIYFHVVIYIVINTSLYSFIYVSIPVITHIVLASLHSSICFIVSDTF